MAEESSPTSDRLFKLSGLLLGVFVVEHILVNASALWGEGTFTRVVSGMQRLPWAPWVELLLIAAPLVIHAAIGLSRLVRGKSPSSSAARPGNERLAVLGRASAIAVLVFIALHVWSLRLWRLRTGALPEATYTRLMEHLSWTSAGIPWVALGTILGVAATTFHLVQTSIAMRKRAPTRRDIVTFGAIGGLLFLLGALTIVTIAGGGRLLSSGSPGMSCEPGTSTASP